MVRKSFFSLGPEESSRWASVLHNLVYHPNSFQGCLHCNAPPVVCDTVWWLWGRLFPIKMTTGESLHLKCDIIMTVKFAFWQLNAALTPSVSHLHCPPPCISIILEHLPACSGVFFLPLSVFSWHHLLLLLCSPSKTWYGEYAPQGTTGWDAHFSLLYYRLDCDINRATVREKERDRTGLLLCSGCRKHNIVC